MNKTALMAKIKGPLLLGSVVIGLSTLASHSSYAYDAYYYACPPYYGYPGCYYPYGGFGFWWSPDHRHFDRGDNGHGHSDHGGGNHGGSGHGGGHGH